MGSSSRSNNVQETTSIDKRITAGGNAFGIVDNTFEGVESVVFNNSDAEVAKAALDTASKLATGSNEIAAQVAKAQESFVATASGRSPKSTAMA